MRAEFHDSAAPSNASTWSQVASGKKSKLAGQAQAGLSKAIAKAGQADNPAKRVHGQCDYFSAKLDICPRGATCHFTCYNGPGKP